MIRARARCGDDDADWLEWTEMPLGRDAEGGSGGAWLHYGALGSGESVQIEVETMAPGPVRVARAEVRATAHG